MSAQSGFDMVGGLGVGPSWLLAAEMRLFGVDQLQCRVISWLSVAFIQLHAAMQLNVHGGSSSGNVVAFFDVNKTSSNKMIIKGCLVIHSPPLLLCPVFVEILF